MRIDDVARELGVRFLLEGSVRIAGNRVRVTAQLIDGISGGHVWAENFDGELDDIFAVQDEITRRIALAMQVNLTYGELARLWEGQTKSLRAWEKMAQARDLFLRFNTIDNRDVQRILKEALGIDPNYTGAMVQLGLSYWWEARFDISADREHCLQLAEQEIEKALGIDTELGSAFMLRGESPSCATSTMRRSRFARRPSISRPATPGPQPFLVLCATTAESAKERRPRLRPPCASVPTIQTGTITIFALANLWMGNFAAAQEAAEADLQRDGGGPLWYALMATIAGFQERDDDAVRMVSELRTRFPTFGIKDVILSERYKEREKLERMLEVLRRAGLPE